jgi:DNA repair protein RadC
MRIIMSRTKALFAPLTYGLPQLKLYLVGEASANLKARTIRKPEEAARLLAPLRHAPEEHFVSLHLNAKHEVIGIHEVSHGTLSASLVHPREVYKAALLANSFAILVCHNHPSGSALTPSQEDFTTTKQLLAAGQLLGVSLIDHLILGPAKKQLDAFFSFREHHPQLWTREDLPS